MVLTYSRFIKTRCGSIDLHSIYNLKVISLCKIKLNTIHRFAYSTCDTILHKLDFIGHMLIAQEFSHLAVCLTTSTHYSVSSWCKRCLSVSMLLNFLEELLTDDTDKKAITGVS